MTVLITADPSRLATKSNSTHSTKFPICYVVYVISTRTFAFSLAMCGFLKRVTDLKVGAKGHIFDILAERSYVYQIFHN